MTPWELAKESKMAKYVIADDVETGVTYFVGLNKGATEVVRNPRTGRKIGTTFRYYGFLAHKVVNSPFMKNARTVDQLPDGVVNLVNQN